MPANEFGKRERLKPTGMKAVAERAGVAISSVSRVLSDHPDVSESMRSRVLDAVAALGYEPDILAQSLRTGETRAIGFVVSDISNPLFALMAHGAEIELRAHGYSVLLASSLNNDELALQQIRRMYARRIDGLMVSAGEETGGPISRLLANSPVPTTLIDRKLGVEGASHVFSAHKTGMRQAVAHLVELGHRRIALVNGQSTVLPAHARAKALRRMAKDDPRLKVSIVHGPFSEAHGESAVTELLTGPNPPTAIIAGGNQLLVGALSALTKLGVSIPGSVSLVSCDSLPLARFLTPDLAVIGRDAQELGMRAAQVMLAHMDDGVARDVSLPTRYLPAGSVAAPRPGALALSTTRREG